MKNFIIIVSFIITCSTLAQDTNIIKYLPLQVGNVWVYSGTSATTYCHGGVWIDKYKIISTSIINNKTYYIYEHSRVYTEGTCGSTISLFLNDAPIRVDSLTMNVYKILSCGSNNEYFEDSLKSNLHDTALGCFRRDVCSDTSWFTLCGISRPAKSFYTGSTETGAIQRYAEGIGLVSYWYYCGGTMQFYLRGCVINGILCGDTSIPVGIEKVGTTVPNSFSLSQNYPNPFNPITKIKFQIAKLGDARLIIYDALGRKVATLVNEQLQPGTYEADWDASNYPSGVYFYKLETDRFTVTKKLVLLK